MSKTAKTIYKEQLKDAVYARLKQYGIEYSYDAYMTTLRMIKIQSGKAINRYRLTETEMREFLYWLDVVLPNKTGPDFGPTPTGHEDNYTRIIKREAE